MSDFSNFLASATGQTPKATPEIVVDGVNLSERLDRLEAKLDAIIDALLDAGERADDDDDDDQPQLDLDGNASGRERNPDAPL
jgi:hypothetical protein